MKKQAHAPGAHLAPSPTFDTLPDSGYARQAHLLTPGPLPISAATLWRHVKAGTFPALVKLSAAVTAWRVGEVRQWLASRSGVAHA